MTARNIFNCLFFFTFLALLSVAPILLAQPYDLSAINCTLRTLAVAVIGSGPAGLTAGSYVAQSKFRTVIFTGKALGGQVVGAGEVENMPGVRPSSGYAIAQTLKEQSARFGAQLEEKTVIDLNLNTWPFIIRLDTGEQVQALSLIIATGAAPRNLNVPGEQEYWSTGVSACSICDCFMAQDKDVVIVGGGDSAAEHALNLSGYAKSITILVRNKKMRASSHMQEKLRNYPKVTVLYGMEVTEICGNGTDVTAVRVKNSDSTGESTIACGAVFIAIGHNPNTALVAPYLELSRFGYIHLASRSQETSIRGVFAAGEVTDDRFRQIAISAGQGVQAAREAIDFLRDIGVTPEYLVHMR